MTENEAISVLEKPSKHIHMVHKTKNEMEFFIFSSDLVKAFETAIQALEKVQALEENETYQIYREYLAIGTVEEFKALKEKSVAKKPKISGVTDSNGIFHEINGINGVPYDLCPNCEINLCTDGMFGGNRSGMKFCKNCGQKLDWGNK